jgi:excisionase family DNA binding protein
MTKTSATPTPTPTPTPQAARLERLLTAGEVAEMLQVSTRFVYARATGNLRPAIRCVRMGSAVRFRYTDIEEFVERCMRGLTTERGRIDD